MLATRSHAHVAHAQHEVRRARSVNTLATASQPSHASLGSAHAETCVDGHCLWQLTASCPRSVPVAVRRPSWSFEATTRDGNISGWSRTGDAGTVSQTWRLKVSASDSRAAEVTRTTTACAASSRKLDAEHGQAMLQQRNLLGSDSLSPISAEDPSSDALTRQRAPKSGGQSECFEELRR